MTFFSFLGHIKKLILRKIKKMREKSDFLSFLFFWTFTTITTYDFSWFKTFYYCRIKYHLFLINERIWFFLKYSYNRRRRIQNGKTFKIFVSKWREFCWRYYDFIYFLLQLSPFVYEGSINIRLKRGNGESVKKRFLY